MKSISATELREWQSTGKNFQLIDIREEHEILEGHIQGQSIPMGDILARVSELRQDCPVVIHCRSGKRSAAVIHALEKKFQLANLYTLEGGYLAFIEQGYSI
jgi:rhodanese-related sulfurtransferase